MQGKKKKNNLKKIRVSVRAVVSPCPGGLRRLFFTSVPAKKKKTSDKVSELTDPEKRKEGRRKRSRSVSVGSTDG